MGSARKTEQGNFRVFVERLGEICGIPFDGTFEAENRILESFVIPLTNDGVHEASNGDYLFMRDVNVEDKSEGKGKPKSPSCVCGHRITQVFRLKYGDQTYPVGNVCIRTYIEHRWGKEDPVHDEMVRKYEETRRLMKGAKKSQRKMIADIRLQRTITALRKKMNEMKLEMHEMKLEMNEKDEDIYDLRGEVRKLRDSQSEGDKEIMRLKEKLSYAGTDDIRFEGSEKLYYENTVRNLAAKLSRLEAENDTLKERLTDSDKLKATALQKLSQWEAWYNANFGGKIAYK